jgi:hypothetical protein
MARGQKETGRTGHDGPLLPDIVYVRRVELGSFVAATTASAAPTSATRGHHASLHSAGTTHALIATLGTTAAAGRTEAATALRSSLAALATAHHGGHHHAAITTFTALALFATLARGHHAHPHAFAISFAKFSVLHLRTGIEDGANHYALFERAAGIFIPENNFAFVNHLFDFILAQEPESPARFLQFHGVSIYTHVAAQFLSGVQYNELIRHIP